MNKLSYKIATGLTTGAIVLSAMAPAAFAANTVTVSGNGNGSTNKAKVYNKQKTKVQQTNSTSVMNLTGVLQNTGRNKANKNTGGAVMVSSGNARSTVTNSTQTGGNVANVENCGCEPEDNILTISGNGNNSTNTTKVTTSHKTVVQQTNETHVVNGTLVVQNTGMNTANSNTGGGTTSVDSGNAVSEVANDVATGSNEVNP